MEKDKALYLAYGQADNDPKTLISKSNFMLLKYNQIEYMEVSIARIPNGSALAALSWMAQPAWVA